MTEQLSINGRTLKLIKGDITDLEIDAFVFYAQHDLALGSGFGTAISVRGGPTIQEELKGLGSLNTCEAIVSGAGELKAKHIVHAVGPRFQEEEMEAKLRKTMENALAAAGASGVTAIAFPAMGVGFYGVPLAMSARIMFETIRDYFMATPTITEIVVCVLDSREFGPFQTQLATMQEPEGVTA